MKRWITPVISDAIMDFCDSIAPSSDPLFVRVAPLHNAVLHECGNNVNQYVSIHGGTIEYGWIIWHHPNIVFEAEAHVIWKDNSGNRLDVTPHIERTNVEILFLPDDYSIEQYGIKNDNRFPPNHIQSCTESSLSKEYAELQTKIFTDFWEKGGSGVSIEEALLEIGTSEQRRRFDQLEAIFNKTLGRNEPCVCQSGIKHKKCCGYNY